MHLDNKKNVLFAVLIFSCILVACTKNVYLRKINGYLNSSTVTDKEKYMSETYHSYFMIKKGPGEDKKAALESFQNWDGPLHPDIKIINSKGNGLNWMVYFNEKNEFAKLIDFPGWRGSMSFQFNSEGLITETLYVPDSLNPSYKLWLSPALVWLRTNMPEELNTVYKDGKLIQNEQSARKWVQLLKIWKSQKHI
jgi:hypothetical protein